MQPFMWRTVQVHLNYNKSVIITHVCLCLLCLHFFLMFVLTLLLITSPFSHFRAGGSRKPRDWQACASSPQDDTLPLPLPGWQTCFLCRSTPSPSLSPLILASGREEGSVRLRYMAALKKKKSVRWVFVYVYKWGSVSYHTLLNTNLAHYSLAGAWAGLSMIHYHNIPPFCTHWMLKHSVPAACSMKGKSLWFKKPTRTGQKLARRLLLQLKWLSFCLALLFLSCLFLLVTKHQCCY